ncbi:lipopolysaccharide biosynthesis protein [Ferruginibacter sp.]
MKKQIFLASVVYTFLSVLQPLSNFILLPVYTKYFSESQYGIFSILNNLNILFTILGGLSIIHAIIAFYSSYSDKFELNRYVGNVLSFATVFNIGLLLLTCIFGNRLFSLIFKEHINYFPDGLLTVSYGLLTNIITGYLFFLKYEKNVFRFAWISIIQFVLNTAMQYVFIVYLKLGITGALTARVIVAFACFLLVLLCHYRYLFFHIDFGKFIKPSLKYSINTIPSSLIAWLSSYGDRFLIERFIDMKSLGIYSFLSTISSLTEMGFLALGAALQPFVFDFFKVENKEKSHHLYRLFLLLSTCLASFIIMAGSNLDLLISNKGYLEIVKYLPVMTIGYIFSAVTYLFSLQIIYAKKSHYFIYFGIIVLFTNISLNAVLIPPYGIWGAVVTSVLTKLIGAISSIYFARRSFSISFKKSNYTTLAMLILLILFCWWLANAGYVAYRTTAILQFIAIIVFMGIVYKKLILQSYQDVLLSIKKK